MFHKVLVPIDGSQGSLNAARVAPEIARRFDSQVTLVHVQHLPTTVLAAPGMAGKCRAASEREATEYAQPISAEYRPTGKRGAGRYTARAILERPGRESVSLCLWKATRASR